jgi:hypothetical protein
MRFRKKNHKQRNPDTQVSGFLCLEAPPGIGPGMKVLQTSALPLGYGAVFLESVVIILWIHPLVKSKKETPLYKKYIFKFANCS